MDFSFTDEQQMMAASVRELLDELCQSADLRKLQKQGATRDAARWRKLAELGLCGPLAPETAGGLGLRAQDFVLIAEACGYALLPEPLVEHAGVCVPLLAESPETAAIADILMRAASGDAPLAIADPLSGFASHADFAAAIIVARDNEVHLVGQREAKLVAQPGVDAFRALSSIGAPLAAGARIATGSDAQALIDRTLDRGALFSAAQLLGVAQRQVDLAVAYAKDRQQFGKPIGSYQAIKHHLANAQVKIEFARPVVYAAAAELELFSLQSRARISHAKLAASDAADIASRVAVQVHGAMGYSWEVDVHLFLKRALALTHAWGGPAFHRARVAKRVFGAPLGPDHTFAAEHVHG